MHLFSSSLVSSNRSNQCLLTTLHSSYSPPPPIPHPFGNINIASQSVIVPFFSKVKEKLKKASKIIYISTSISFLVGGGGGGRGDICMEMNQNKGEERKGNGKFISSRSTFEIDFEGGLDRIGYRRKNRENDRRMISLFLL